MLHALNKTNTTNTTIHDLFFISKFAMLRKIKFVSKEDTNKFLFKIFLDLHLMKMHISFLFEKNLDLHLMKTQIRF